jgi:hypothetical protein
LPLLAGLKVSEPLSATTPAQSVGSVPVALQLVTFAEEVQLSVTGSPALTLVALIVNESFGWVPPLLSLQAETPIKTNSRAAACRKTRAIPSFMICSSLFNETGLCQKLTIIFHLQQFAFAES